jgi:hypothetical protein
MSASVVFKICVLATLVALFTIVPYLILRGHGDGAFGMGVACLIIVCVMGFLASMEEAHDEYSDDEDGDEDEDKE